MIQFYALKNKIITHLDILSGDALRTQSVNTISIKDGNLIGHNTDIDGFELSIKKINYDLKDKTADIVAKNKDIEAKILEQGLKDSNGDIMASPALQQALVRNNLPRAFALARDAAGKANSLTLEEALKQNDVMEWYSEYSLKLTELARTYRAKKDGKKGDLLSRGVQKFKKGKEKIKEEVKKVVPKAKKFAKAAKEGYKIGKKLTGTGGTSPAKKEQPHGVYADQGLIKSYKKGDKYIAIDGSSHDDAISERQASAKALTKAKAKARANRGKSSPAKMKSPMKKDGERADLLSRGGRIVKKGAKKFIDTHPLNPKNITKGRKAINKGIKKAGKKVKKLTEGVVEFAKDTQKRAT